MKININKLIAGLIYCNVVTFVAFFIAPLISYTISSKLYYELNDKLNDKNDLLISNIYNDDMQPYGSNTFEYDMNLLPVRNHFYSLPELNLYFVCENSPQNVQFLRIVENIDGKNVRTNVVNIFCNKEFDYFLERKESLRGGNAFMRMMNYLITPDSKDVPMETMDNLNFVHIKNDNSKYISTLSKAYTIQVDYLGNKNIKLLTRSSVLFSFDINNEIFIKKIISRHPYLIKCFCFISVYSSLLFVISLTFIFLYNLNNAKTKTKTKVL